MEVQSSTLWNHSRLSLWKTPWVTIYGLSCSRAAPDPPLFGWPKQEATPRCLSANRRRLCWNYFSLSDVISSFSSLDLFYKNRLALALYRNDASRADSICVTSSRKRHDLYQRLCSSLGTAATNYADSCSARASPTRGCTKVSASCPRKRSTRWLFRFSWVFSQLDGHWFLSVYVFNIMHIYLTATMSLVTHRESRGFEMFVYRR